MVFQITILTLKLITLVKFTKSELTGFIVGGEFSNIEDFPYSVHLSISCAGASSACGASILNQVILLTAAHCVIKCKNGFTIKGYTGSKYRHKGFENNIVSFRIHEKYNDDRKSNDIALLRLKNNLTFGEKVKRVALMKEPLNYEYETAVVAGWGWIDSVGTKGNVLKHSSQRILSRTKCTGLLNSIPIGTICGRELEGRSYPERGDSGSALVVKNFIQIGIVSFKKRAYSNDTIVYTDVSYHYDWIEKNAEEMYCDGKSKKRILRKGKGKTVEDKKINRKMEKKRAMPRYHFL